MNILMIASDNNITSGAFRSMATLCKLLENKNINVKVIIPIKGDGTVLLDEYGIKYEYVYSGNWIVPKKFNLFKYLKVIIKILLYNFIAIKKIQKIIKKENIDIVHINTSYSYVGAIAALKERKKLIWHLREFLEEDQNNKILRKKVGLKLINKSNKIICISKAIYDKYENIFDKDKMKIIYNGIDIEKFYQREKKIFQNNNVIKMICIGQITEKKGQIELVEAIGKCIGLLENYNIELNLVGRYTKKEKNKVDVYISKYNLKNIINFKGKCSNVQELLQDSDIAFMCSISEAFGRVTVESMLAGCLVIGKECAATKEIIKNNETGILYRDINDLSNKIIYSIQNSNYMKIIANNGREFSKNNFSALNNANNIVNEYMKL